MSEKNLVNKVIGISLALLIAFLIAESLIMPSFRRAWEKGFGVRPLDDPTNLFNEFCVKPGAVAVCTNCNVSEGAGYETFLSTCHSLIGRQNGTHCNACDDFGFKLVARGLLVLTFAMIFISMAIAFLKKDK